MRSCASQARSHPRTDMVGCAKKALATCSNSGGGRKPVAERSFSPSASTSVHGSHQMLAEDARRVDGLLLGAAVDGRGAFQPGLPQAEPHALQAAFGQQPARCQHVRG
ncbi:MAG: hypothetical protein U1F00_03960 [Rhodoferax sp.]